MEKPCRNEMCKIDLDEEFDICPYCGFSDPWGPPVQDPAAALTSAPVSVPAPTSASAPAADSAFAPASQTRSTDENVGVKVPSQPGQGMESSNPEAQAPTNSTHGRRKRQGQKVDLQQEATKGSIQEPASVAPPKSATMSDQPAQAPSSSNERYRRTMAVSLPLSSGQYSREISTSITPSGADNPKESDSGSETETQSTASLQTAGQGRKRKRGHRGRGGKKRVKRASTAGIATEDSETTDSQPQQESGDSMEVDKSSDIQHLPDALPRVLSNMSPEHQYCHVHHNVGHVAPNCPPTATSFDFAKAICMPNFEWHGAQHDNRLAKVHVPPADMTSMFKMLYHFNQSLSSYEAFCINADHLFEQLSHQVRSGDRMMNPEVYVMWLTFIARFNLCARKTLMALNEIAMKGLDAVAETVKSHVDDGSFGAEDELTQSKLFSALFDLDLVSNPPLFDIKKFNAIERNIAHHVLLYEQDMHALQLQMDLYIDACEFIYRSAHRSDLHQAFQLIASAQVRFASQTEGVGLQIVKWPQLVLFSKPQGLFLLLPDDDAQQYVKSAMLHTVKGSASRPGQSTRSAQPGCQPS